MEQTIPHILHQTWKTQNIPDDLLAYRQSWKDCHPDWTFYLWTDFDNREFIRKQYSWFLPIYDAYPEAIMRADAVRYFILHHFGGVYADLDYECLQSMEPLLEGKRLVFGLEPEKHLEIDMVRERNLDRIVCNAWMASVPAHPFWDHVHRKLVEYHDQEGVLDATGPFLFTRACQTYPKPEQISFEPARLLYPITSEIPWVELPEETRQQVLEKAYGIHHWMNSWWHRYAGEKKTLCLASQLEQNQEISRFWMRVEKYLAIQNKRTGLPRVSCLMVTKNRPALAIRAVDCYRRQTYRNRELIILDDGTDQALEQYVQSLAEPDIRFIRLEPQGKTLGELRNLAVESSGGEFVAQWDDDDLSDPNRLEIQMAAILNSRSDACLLRRHMIWFPARRRLAISNERHWESSFVCRKDCMPAYPALRKGEDTAVIDQIVADRRVISLDYPQLYLYIFHGANTFEEEHWENCWLSASRAYEGDAYRIQMAELNARMGIDLSIYHDDDRVAPCIAEKKEEDIPVPSTPARTFTGPAVDYGKPAVLILVPVKDAEDYLPVFFENLHNLTYPHQKISIAFLESDSRDRTYNTIDQLLTELRTEFAGAELYKRDYGYLLTGSRWETNKQYLRRSILAKSRNYLLSRALRDEDWVLWLDVDVARYPADIIETMLAVKKEILVPNCLTLGSDCNYDLNSFKIKPDAGGIDWRPYIVDGILQPPAGVGRWYLNDLRMYDVVELDGVGAAMLLVKADLHREGLIFPPYSYHYYIETEALAVMAREMGYRSFGLPKVVIHHPGGSG
jgi:GT2 family glycosyltransferase